MFKRPKAQIIIGLMAAWFLISIYFYFQHIVTVKTDLLFEKMDFGDERIIITEVRLDNYQRKPQEAWDNLPWYYNTKIPHQILYRFSEAVFFYSSPYTKYDDSGFLTVRGIKLGSIYNQEPDKCLDDFRERYDIRITNAEDQPFSINSYSAATIETNGNILHFQHDKIPVSDDIDTVKVVVTDSQTGLYQTLSLHPHWEEYNLNYFSRYSIYPSRNYEPGKTAKTFVNSILDEHRYISEKLLHPKCRENIDWSILDHDLWNSQRENCVLYEGSYQGFHDVFSYYMNFTNSDGADAPITGSQKIYLLFQDDTWQVLDVSPLGKLLHIGDINKNIELTEYDPQNSITYHQPYSDLSAELLYARLLKNSLDEKETVRVIRDKQDLVEIVREFDKLKAVYPEETYEFPPGARTSYVLTMWREGTSVSYVIYEAEQNYYYCERCGIPLREIPDKLLGLLGFQDKLS